MRHQSPFASCCPRLCLGMSSTAKLSSTRPKPASDPHTTTRPDWRRRTADPAVRREGSPSTRAPRPLGFTLVAKQDDAPAALHPAGELLGGCLSCWGGGTATN